MKNILVPGSKSVSNRALVLVALSTKPTILRNLLACDDTNYLRASLSNFGVQFEQIGINDWKVTPPEKLQGNNSDNFIGNGGTPARFLVALSTVVEGSFTLRGVDRMHERPFSDLFSAVKQLGVKIQYLGEEGYLPAKFTNLQSSDRNLQLKISGKVSSQFMSGLLLIAPKLGGLEIEITDEIPSRPYVEMTVEMLKIWGVQVVVSKDFKHFSVEAPYQGVLKGPLEYHIPADCSSASYPVIYSLLSKKPICIQNYGAQTLQGDEGFLEVIKKAGAEVQREEDAVTVLPGKVIKPLGKIDFSKMPDVSMSGMVLASFTDGGSHFTGLESLRVKECDRIQAMVKGLEGLGINVEEKGDEIKIKNEKLEIRNEPKANSQKLIASHDDHRIAMVFGIIREVFRLDFEISHPDCVAKSWPDFWLELADWGGALREVAGVIVRREQETNLQSSNGNLQSEKNIKPANRQSLKAKSYEYLIVKKPRKEHAWQFPQGGVDEGETLIQAAERELQEECGESLQIKCKSEEPVGNYKYFFPADFTRHNENIKGAKVSFFLARYLSGEVKIDQKEIIEYRWVKKEELKDYFEKSYIRNVLHFMG